MKKYKITPEQLKLETCEYNRIANIDVCIGSSYCVFSCKYCTNYEFKYEDDYYTFTCNFITRKEKLEKLEQLTQEN